MLAPEEHTGSPGQLEYEPFTSDVEVEEWLPRKMRGVVAGELDGSISIESMLSIVATDAPPGAMVCPALCRLFQPPRLVGYIFD
ncbi:hypothetical protein [Streptomyces purpureus]|uniref:hypothetical protein n=1 Tax=Streptomyces purpureus TaxID=1951 RepID=UPI00167110EF|nr:hypothetical protein [Streptomyces purpureus]